MSKTRSNLTYSQIDETQMESIITKVSDILLKRIDEKLENMASKFDAIDQTLKNVNRKFTQLENVQQSNTIQIKTIEEKMDELNQNSRNNRLRLIGIKEEVNENLLSKVISLFNDALKIKCSIFDLNSVYRIGKVVKNDMKPRGIIVDFVSNIKRNEVYKSKINLKGTEIFINEDLTDFRYKLLRDARLKFGNKEAWSLNGKIYMKHGNIRKNIQREADLQC